MYVLDTDTYSNFLRNGDHQKIRDRILSVPAASISLSAITAEELIKGRLSVINSGRNAPGVSAAYDYLLDIIKELNKVRILRFDEEANRLFQSWPNKVKQTNPQDCRIAAVACVNNLVVVTCNTKHFSQIAQEIPEVQYEDWSI